LVDWFFPLLGILPRLFASSQFLGVIFPYFSFLLAVRRGSRRVIAALRGSFLCSPFLSKSFCSVVKGLLLFRRLESGLKVRSPPVPRLSLLGSSPSGPVFFLCMALSRSSGKAIYTDLCPLSSLDSWGNLWARYRATGVFPWRVCFRARGSSRFPSLLDGFPVLVGACDSCRRAGARML